MRRLLPGTPITEYGDLEGKALEEVTDAAGHGIVLWVSEETAAEISGHWLAIVTVPDGVLLFDPYGSVRADPWHRNAEDMTPYELEEQDQSRPVLEKLVRASGKRVLFNKQAYQADRRDINTCGRHCVVRIWHADLTNEEYSHTLHAQGGNADTVVTALTDGVLQGTSSNRRMGAAEE